MLVISVQRVRQLAKIYAVPALAPFDRRLISTPDSGLGDVQTKLVVGFS